MRMSLPACAFAILVAAFSPLSARATWTEDAQRCYTTTGDDNAKITYCTRAIESGQLDDKDFPEPVPESRGLVEGPLFPKLLPHGLT